MNISYYDTSVEEAKISNTSVSKLILKLENFTIFLEAEIMKRSVFWDSLAEVN
jgi:hypothetical protein